MLTPENLTIRPCDAAYKKTVRLACYDALEWEGFSRFRKEDVDWPLGDGFHAWVGLNTGLYASHVEINPHVGVHVIPIEKLWHSLDKGKYATKYNRGYATYAIHMGEIAPNEDVFHFARNTDIRSEARRLARLYASVGLDYAKSIANYEVLLPLLSDFDRLGTYPQRVSCCLYLMGRVAEARAFTEDFLGKERDSFVGFARPFLRMIDGELSKDGRSNGLASGPAR